MELVELSYESRYTQLVNVGTVMASSMAMAVLACAVPLLRWLKSQVYSQLRRWIDVPSSLRPAWR